MSDAWDGRPVEPGRTQVAWLRCGEHEPEPALWCSLHNAWFMFDGGSPSKPSDIAETFNYLGPCLTPAEVAAREAAAWCGGRDAAAGALMAHLRYIKPRADYAGEAAIYNAAIARIASVSPPADLAAAAAQNCYEQLTPGDNASWVSIKPAAAATCDAVALPYPLDAYVDAPSGAGPLAYDWKDKPHRLVYDLVNAIRARGRAGA